MAVTIEARNQELDAAKKRVLNGWVQGHFAIDHLGKSVNSQNSYANAFCAQGACAASRTADWHMLATITQALTAALKALGLGDGSLSSLPTYNDAPGRTKYEVAALFDRAKEMPL